MSELLVQQLQSGTMKRKRSLVGGVQPDVINNIKL